MKFFIADKTIGLHKWYKISLINEKYLKIENKISKNSLCSFVNWFLENESFSDFFCLAAFAAGRVAGVTFPVDANRCRESPPRSRVEFFGDSRFGFRKEIIVRIVNNFGPVTFPPTATLKR
jgi:hypothetical protein